jgi:integrase/recombinase XerC
MQKRPSDYRVSRLGSSENRRTAALRHLGVRQGVTRQARERRQPPTIRLSVPLPQLLELGALWVQDAEDAARSPRTIGGYRDLVRRVGWLAEREGWGEVGPDEVREFLAYVRDGHEEPGGRWGNPRNSKNLRPVTPTTLAAYHRDLKAWFNFVKAPAGLAANPLDGIPRAHAAAPVIETFTPGQFQALLRAAGRSYFPARDTALLWFLVDTGARRSEAADLLSRAVDITSRRALVLGKGRKERILPFGPSTARALHGYRLQLGDLRPAHFFVAGQGRFCEERLTGDGVYQVVERLGEAAGIQGVRCSPHTCRHTFAIEFLRGGGGELALQEILGHSSLEMVKRYSRLARADIQEKHRQASPGERLRRG